MSHFYGTLQGSRGEATRCAAGWDGAIRVQVYQDHEGNDRYTVDLVPWQNSGGQSRQLADGILKA